MMSAGKADDGDNERSLWCGNLHERVTEELLHELFLQAGPIESTKITQSTVRDGKSFAFITFKHAVSVSFAINLLSGVSLFSRKLSLQTKRFSDYGSSCNYYSLSNTPASTISRNNLAELDDVTFPPRRLTNVHQDDSTGGLKQLREGQASQDRSNSVQDGQILPGTCHELHTKYDGRNLTSKWKGTPYHTNGPLRNSENEWCDQQAEALSRDRWSHRSVRTRWIDCNDKRSRFDLEHNGIRYGGENRRSGEGSGCRDDDRSECGRSNGHSFRSGRSNERSSGNWHNNGLSFACGRSNRPSSGRGRTNGHGFGSEQSNGYSSERGQCYVRSSGDGRDVKRKSHSVNSAERHQNEKLVPQLMQLFLNNLQAPELHNKPLYRSVNDYQQSGNKVNNYSGRQDKSGSSQVPGHQLSQSYRRYSPYGGSSHRREEFQCRMK